MTDDDLAKAFHTISQAYNAPTLVRSLVILLAPPVEWRATMQELSQHEVQQVGSSLDVLMQQAARLRGYLDEVELNGVKDDVCHAAAVVQSNRTLAKVRKALGYTYPRQDISF